MVAHRTSPRVLVVSQVDTTVVPRVSFGVEAACRLDRDERRLGDVGRALEEAARGRV